MLRDYLTLPDNGLPVSIPAAIPPRPAPARNTFAPVPICELGPGEPPDYLWSPMLARGIVTLFSAPPKAGKSTLITSLLRDMANGDGLVTAPCPAPVLIVSEESAGIWARRRDEWGLPTSIHIHARPFAFRPSLGEWEDYIAQAAEWVQREGAQLAVIDTLSGCWCVAEENSAPEVGAAIRPVAQIADAGAAVLLVHHTRKSGGSEGAAARGSNALAAGVDIVAEFSRMAKDDPHDRRRELRVYSRIGEDDPASVLELTDAGYVRIGTRESVAEADRDGAILALLPADGPGITAEEMLARWQDESKPSMRTLQGQLVYGANKGRWLQSGRGVKGDPFRFRRKAAEGFPQPAHH